MIGRDGGNAQIDRFLFDLHLNAPVLWQTLFRDAHRTGHDFEPAKDGRLQTLRGRLHFLENAVDAKTNTEFFVERLEMNVASTKLVCLDDQHRNQPNDWRVGVIGSDRFGAVTDLETKIDILADFVPQNVDRFFRGAIVFD